MTDLLAGALADAVGERHVLLGDDVRAPFERDWTGRFGGPARAVVRPGSTGEVAAILRACADHGAAVVPQGGNTGLVGGGVPRAGEVVVSLGRLTALGDVDAASAQVDAGAGATLAALQTRARDAGLDAGVDFAARDSATIGGLVATDAGGIRALRHGTVRARVAGLEAVLADGSVIDRTSGLLKDNAGYDLPALLVGSEGTLGIVTRVRWRLVAPLGPRVAALAGVASLGAAAGALAALRARLPRLDAAEFLLDDGLELVLAHLGLPSPLPARSPAYVIVECPATEDLPDALEAAGLGDAVIADDTAGRERLWRVREHHTEAIAAAGVAHKLDVGVPLQRLGEFETAVRAGVARVAPEARVLLFGHLGDGNVHVNVLGVDPEDEAADEVVLALAARLGGTISAEHGVGVAKARFLHLVRSEGELTAMRAIKHALDPSSLLNPGCVLER
ncbi:MAG: FAD-binding oxidoreductase [Solirubrobacteraceae bacterium]